MYRMTFVRLPLEPFVELLTRAPGSIGQVAEELWEVANKTIRNLTKEDRTEGEGMIAYIHPYTQLEGSLFAPHLILL